MAIKEKAGELEGRIQEWAALRDLEQARRPSWDVVEKFARHASTTSRAKTSLDQLAAIREQRLLLEKSDPATSVPTELAGLLREDVQGLHAAQQAAFAEALEGLASNAAWAKLSDTDRQTIRVACGLVEPAKADLGTDELLVAALDAKPLAAMQAEIDAIPGRVARAIEPAGAQGSAAGPRSGRHCMMPARSTPGSAASGRGSSRRSPTAPCWLADAMATLSR